MEYKNKLEKEIMEIFSFFPKDKILKIKVDFEHDTTLPTRVSIESNCGEPYLVYYPRKWSN